MSTVVNRFAWRNLLAWALSAFFILGGVMNIAAPASIVDDYARWGYPDWFHYVTGALELLCAALLIRQGTRRFGVVLGLLVMGAALLTLLVHREWTHGVLPALAILGLIATASRNSKRSRK